MKFCERIQFVVVFFFAFFVPANSTALAQTLHTIKPIIVHTNVHTQGRVAVHLTHEKIFQVDTGAKFYQGHVKLRSMSYPVAAAKINGELRITFHGKITGSRQSRQRTFTIKSRNNFTTTRVSSLPRSAHPVKACATESHDHTTKSVKQANDTNFSSHNVITISTTADAEWASRFGATSNAEIASLINTAETLYANELGIEFQIVSQIVQTDSTPEIDPSVILSTFQKTTPITANAHYLFTGKDMSGSAIGIAYVGTICYAPNYAYGVVQYYSTLTSNVFAHELGHNLGARHDFYSYGSLMYPSVSPGIPYISTTTLNEINDFLSHFGSCLAHKQPDKIVAAIRVRRSGRIIMSTVVDNFGDPIAHESVTLSINGKKTQKTTNSKGTVFSSIKHRRGTKIRFTIKANSNNVSKTITFKIQ